MIPNRIAPYICGTALHFFPISDSPEYFSVFVFSHFRYIHKVIAPTSNAEKIDAWQTPIQKFAQNDLMASPLLS